MALRWLFTAETAPFKKGLAEMRTETKAFSRSITRMVGGIFSGAAVALGFRQWIRNIDDLAKRAQKLGTTVEELQRVEFVGAKSGLAAQQLTALIVRLERRFGEAARGSKSFQAALDNLGISQANLKASDPQAAILALSAAWIRAKGSGTEYADLLRLLDTEARELIPLLNQGPAALEEQMNKAAVVTGKTAARVEALNDRMTDLGNRVSVGFSYVFSSIGLIGESIGTFIAAGIRQFKSLFTFMVDGFKAVGASIHAALTLDLKGIELAVGDLRDSIATAMKEAGTIAVDTANLLAESWEDAFGRVEKAREKAFPSDQGGFQTTFGGPPTTDDYQTQEQRDAERLRSALFPERASPSRAGLLNPSGPPESRSDFLRPIDRLNGLLRQGGHRVDDSLLAQEPIPRPSLSVTSLRSIGGDARGINAPGPAERGLKIAELQLEALRDIAAKLQPAGPTPDYRPPRG